MIEWIKCSERKPTNIDRYLVCEPWNNSWWVGCQYFNGCFFEEDRCSCKGIPSKITHWAELPEPPKDKHD